MKFLCDVMLSRLGRWLRAAGYDTVIAEAGQADRDLLKSALREGRLFISLDRKLLQHRDAESRVIILNSNKIGESIKEVTELLGIDWLHRPFSRCLLCNALLVAAGPGERQHLPEDVRENSSTVYYCASCNQSFWQGSHVTRMRNKLAAWNRL